MFEFRLPNLGEGVEKAQVVGIFVKEGDFVKEDDPLLEVESNKAVLVVPSPVTGVVKKIHVQKGDEVSLGALLMELELEKGIPEEEKNEREAPKQEVYSKEEKQVIPQEKEEKAFLDPVESSPPRNIHLMKTQAIKEEKMKASAPVISSQPFLPTPSELAKIPAGPATRKLARELGVDLREVWKTKGNGRLTVEDVKEYVKYLQKSKTALAGGVESKGVSSQAVSKPPLPDFSKFGPYRREPLSMIRKIISERMTYSWTHIPHVHQFHKADITDITAFHKKYSQEFKAKGSTTSVTTFIIKALAHCLKKFPQFNASLDEEKQELVLKGYFNIGVAVDTPAGLIVPVIRDVDKMTIFEIGKSLRDLAQRARERKVTPEELSGASITVSNLGGIGGSFFTPIINYPEVAILGVGRQEVECRYQDGSWVPRTMLPLCLAYDHRVIDGADGARFIVELGEVLENFERFLLGG